MFVIFIFHQLVNILYDLHFISNTNLIYIPYGEMYVSILKISMVDIKSSSQVWNFVGSDWLVPPLMFQGSVFSFLQFSFFR